MRRRPAPPWLWTGAALVVAGLLAVPVVAVLTSIAHPAVEVWAHLWRTQLPELVWNTLLLLAGVGAGVLVLGTALAWLVVAHDFPGRRLFEWALVLPLAMPAYVIGFAFLGLVDYAGPLQTALRAWLPGLRLPDPRSYAGVVTVMILVFYPYVYLLARSAFREHGTTTLETARSLGRTRGQAFRSVVLPLARPSLVAGTALAMMEALADFGTVATFGYRTLTEAVYRVWYGMFDRAAASQLACLLLFTALGLLALERALRGRARFTQATRRGTATARVRLTGVRAAAATGFVGVVLGLAFVIPAAQLALWARGSTEGWRHAVPGFGTVLTSTVTLAALAAVISCALAVVLAYAARMHRTRVVAWATRFASMGYALPGAVIAVGVLLPLAWLDHRLTPVAEALTGRRLPLLLTGSAAALVFAYVVRFAAVAFGTVEASLVRIAPSLDEAARSLGATLPAALRRVHLPLLRGGLGTALVLVFVETVKELPATLLLRPFGLNTLAIAVWERTSESQWAEAAVPALAIVIAGLGPVVLALRLSSRDR